MSEATGVKISRRVFNDVYIPYLNNLSRMQIFFGGSASGKSRFLAQRTVIDVLNGHNYLVCRAVASTIKRSVFQEILNVIRDWNLSSEFLVNKSELTITCQNDYQILFSGLDDVEKIKSITPQRGPIDRIWVEEATEIQAEDIKQLRKRQRGGGKHVKKTITLSFNPILRSHHLFRDYFAPIGWADDQEVYSAPDDSLSILRTWYIHNRFLTEQDVYDLVNETDEYFREVYTYGKFGVLGDVVFRNWVVANLSDEDSEFYLPEEQRVNRYCGLDFGFSSDPSAMPVTYYDRKRKRIYIFEELYEKGLTNDLLAKQIKEMIGKWYLVSDDGALLEAKNWKEAERIAEEYEDLKPFCKTTEYVTCDSSEPKSVMELQRLGINALPAKKGKDSIDHGIDWLKRQKIIIDKKCINAQSEFQQYQWKKDRNGESLKIPVDRHNHLIDALRYAYENEMQAIDPLKVFDAV